MELLERNFKCNRILTGGRIKWIDCAKAIAIIAVAVDHCQGVLYTNQLVAYASYFSVSLFILLSGISTWISDEKTNKKRNKSVEKIKKLCMQYAIATLILYIVYTKSFDLRTYVSYLLNFSITGPYYFFVFFIQLTMITPILLVWCKFCNRYGTRYILQIVTLLFLGYVSSVCIRFTYILPVHGGGQYLFGGTYLILYYIGIWLGSMHIFDINHNKKVIVLVCSVMCWVFWWLMMAYGKLPFDSYMSTYWGEGFNPPSIQFMIFSVITLALLYSLFSLLEESRNGYLQRLVKCFSTLGEYTLYIFMYHLLVKDMIMTYFPIVNSWNIWVKRLVIFVPMIILPVLGIILVRKLMKTVVVD